MKRKIIILTAVLTLGISTQVFAAPCHPLSKGEFQVEL